MWQLHLPVEAVAAGNSKAQNTWALGPHSHDWHLCFDTWGLMIKEGRMSFCHKLFFLLFFFFKEFETEMLI